MSGRYLVAGKKLDMKDYQENYSRFGDVLEMFDSVNESVRNKVYIETKTDSLRAEDINVINDFTEIGTGKPLLIELMTTYMGNVDTKKAFIVTSAIREYNGGPATRAVNLYEEGNKFKSKYVDPSATTQGKFISFYTPALVKEPLICTFEVNIDEFDKRVLILISDLLEKAGDIPVFIPAQGFFVVGTKIAKLIGKLLNFKFELDPILTDTITIDFSNYPKRKQTQPKYASFYNDDYHDEFEAYSCKWVDVGGDEKMRLVHKKTKEVYTGDHPYIIALIDGKERSQLKNFKRQMITAKQLDQFFKKDDLLDIVSETIEEVLYTYNDAVHLKAAKGKLDELNKLDQDYLKKKITKEVYDKKSAELKMYIEGYNKHIQDNDFPKVKVP